MARMHSGKKGRAGSKKPLFDQKLPWLSYKKKEVELLIAKLVKEGHTQSEIGIILRDTYGIPDVKKVTGSKISQILQEKKMVSKLPEDLTALMKRYVAIQRHLSENRKDTTAKRGLELTNSKIRRLVKYYKKTKRLPEEWKYDPANIRMYIE
ncbi:30S ribosomal protein S15 [Candidatus Woesearchaeota archaeon]|nr:30S ribosomal protein S15 [Candidatus Woesearchaeota archaeon]